MSIKIRVILLLLALFGILLPDFIFLISKATTSPKKAQENAENEIAQEFIRQFNQNPQKTIDDIKIYAGLENYFMVIEKTKYLLKTGNAEIIEMNALATAALRKQQDEKKIKENIDPNAIFEITSATHPNLYKSAGKEKIKHINNLLKSAAKKIVLSENCDYLKSIDYSDSRSSPLSNKIVFLADCLNGNRFYISEPEINAAANVASEQDKMRTVSDGDAAEKCKASVIGHLQFPSSFSENWGGTSIYRAPSTGNIVVSIDFEAKNGLGLNIPQRARCVIDSNGIGSPEIFNR